MNLLVELFLIFASLVAVVTLVGSVIGLIRWRRTSDRQANVAEQAPQATPMPQAYQIPQAYQTGYADRGTPAGRGAYTPIDGGADDESQSSPWGLMTVLFASALTAANARSGKQKQAERKGRRGRRPKLPLARKRR